MHQARKPLFWGSALFCFYVAFPALAQNLATGNGLEIPFARIGAGLVICLLIAFAAGLAMRNLRLRESFGGVSARSDHLSFSWLNMSRFNVGRHDKLENIPGEIRVLETRKLTPTADICRVTVSGEAIVLAISQSTIEVLYRQSVHDDTYVNNSSDKSKAAS